MLGGLDDQPWRKVGSISYKRQSSACRLLRSPVLSFSASVLEQHEMEPSPSSGLRVRSSHLLVWTLGCAVGFATYRWLTPPWAWPAKSGMQILSAAYNLLMGVAFGTLLAGSGVLAYRRGQGNRSYPSLPGHWLLLFGIAAALADGVAVVVFRSLVAAWFSPGDYITVYWLAYRMTRNPNLPGMFHQCVGWGLGSVFALAFLWGLKRRLSWPWRGLPRVFSDRRGPCGRRDRIDDQRLRPFRMVRTPPVVSSGDPPLRRVRRPLYRADSPGHRS